MLDFGVDAKVSNRPIPVVQMLGRLNNDSKIDHRKEDR
jgi:hypothetical protein